MFCALTLLLKNGFDFIFENLIRSEITILVHMIALLFIHGKELLILSPQGKVTIIVQYMSTNPSVIPVQIKCRPMINSLKFKSSGAQWLLCAIQYPLIGIVHFL